MFDTVTETLKKIGKVSILEGLKTRCYTQCNPLLFNSPFQESLLTSQFEALEEPNADESQWIVNVIDCESGEEEVFKVILDKFQKCQNS